MPSFVNVRDIAVPTEFYNRMKTGVESIDALFSEGILPGSVTTIAARHGTGKTQFCLHLLEYLNGNGHRVGYASNEETVEQLAFTCRRINAYNVPLANVSSVRDVEQLMDQVEVLVIDSFSKLKVDDVKGARAIERAILDAVIAKAKSSKCAVFFIMHQTKMGQVKGSSLIEHDVDATLFIKKLEEEDADSSLRRIYFEKNRFGSPNEILVKMTACGYDFSPQQPPEKPTTEKAPSKRETLYTDIESLDMNDFTVLNVAKTLDIPYNKAQNALYIMTREGRLLKTGRGMEAKYSLPTKQITV